jgi:hypothetical protein
MTENVHAVRSNIADREHKVLTAVSQATGRDMGEIVRDLIRSWAEEEIHRATTVTQILRSCEGSSGTAGD